MPSVSDVLGSENFEWKKTYSNSNSSSRMSSGNLLTLIHWRAVASLRSSQGA